MGCSGLPQLTAAGVPTGTLTPATRGVFAPPPTHTHPTPHPTHPPPHSQTRMHTRTHAAAAPPPPPTHSPSPRRGQVGVFVSIVSTKIPFKGAGKEYMGAHSWRGCGWWG